MVVLWRGCGYTEDTESDDGLVETPPLWAGSMKRKTAIVKMQTVASNERSLCSTTVDKLPVLDTYWSPTELERTALLQPGDPREKTCFGQAARVFSKCSQRVVSTM